MELLRHGHMPSFAAMLAYVFWHWPRPNMNAAQYEAAQRAFHAALDAAPPAGFSASHSAALRGVPWAAGGGPAYEDWYLVQASASLDPLNQAAITGSRQQPHDGAAALAAGGAAGLYLLRAGEPVIPPARAIWFGKPSGMTYAELDRALRDVVASGACVWMRYMVLGPTPEFCLHGGAGELPRPLTGMGVELRSVWRG